MVREYLLYSECILHTTELFLLRNQVFLGFDCSRYRMKGVVDRAIPG